MPKWYLGLLVLFLLLQLALRTAHIDRQLVFMDEGLHINRAVQLHDQDPYPALQSYEKLFLYVLLAVFDLTKPGAMVPLARLVVALFSLLASAAIFSVINYFTHQKYALLGVLFYALVPHAVFYERLTLTDSIAGALGAILIWQSIRAAAKPTHRNTLLLGIIMMITVAAKLNMLFVIVFPSLAVLFCGHYKSLGEAYKRYASTLFFSSMIFVALWLLMVFIPLSIHRHNLPVNERIPTGASDLLNDDYSLQFLQARLQQLWMNLKILCSSAFSFFAVGIVVVGLIRRPRVVAFLVACLFFASIPHLILIAQLRTRYQVSSLPILTILVGTSVGVLLPEKPIMATWGFRLAAVSLMVWAVLFALPFDRTIISDPPQSKLPFLDEWEYFQGPYNAYGNWEAIHYVDMTFDGQNESVLVLPLTKMCPFMPYYQWTNLEVKCLAKPFQETVAKINWEPTALELLKSGKVVYTTTDGNDNAPPDSPLVEWSKVEEFFRTGRLRKVVLWRLTLR